MAFPLSSPALSPDGHCKGEEIMDNLSSIKAPLGAWLKTVPFLHWPYGEVVINDGIISPGIHFIVDFCFSNNIIDCFLVTKS